MRIEKATLAFAILILLPFPLLAASSPDAPVVCAAFSRSGMSAQASVSARTLIVSWRDAQGAAVELSAQTAGPGERCTAAFSDDGRYLAVEIGHPQQDPQPLEIAVWDCEQRAWLSAKPFLPLLPRDFHGSLQGFLKDSRKMVLADSGMYFDDRDRTSLFPFLEEIDPHTRSLVARNDARAFPGTPLRNWNGVADAAANRLWFKGGLSGCAFQSVSLTGKWERGPVLDEKWLRAEGCTAPDLVLSAADAVVIAAKSGSTITFWKAGMNGHDVEKLELPSGGKYVVILGKGAAISPDRTLLAVSLLRFPEPLPGVLKDAQPEIVVVQMNPFQLLGTVRGNPAGLAVGRTQGRIQVVHWDGQWKEEQVPIASAPLP